MVFPHLFEYLCKAGSRILYDIKDGGFPFKNTIYALIANIHYCVVGLNPLAFTVLHYAVFADARYIVLAFVLVAYDFNLWQQLAYML